MNDDALNDVLEATGEALGVALAFIIDAIGEGEPVTNELIGVCLDQASHDARFAISDQVRTVLASMVRGVLPHGPNGG